MANNKTELSDETILKISKEIVIKFIEVGRVTPTNFNESFSKIHESVKDNARK
ncbi:MAG: hypothetical protein OCC45_15030 [Desulfotalea sp.]